ncbi:BatD family protein [uncultured Algibacter sp.]|uniref:BatD family protein n=1 Tax=uncultured Algibacter sp. TaxID=298659 RepID=UPI002621DF9E|nr:BatD family protein [uncultured Algibacter sp.]
MVKNIGIVIAFFLLPFIGMSQNIIAYATVNTNEAYIGQPVKLTVSVYTSTWFTEGVDLGNIQIDNALTVYFRSVSNSRAFSGKNYAGVSFYYNVFPTEEGQITIPSLSINIASPKPGDYKGLKKTVTTKPKSFNVLPVPLGYNPNNWLVATYLNVNQKWSTALDNIKVGDVVQRTIDRSAGGTMAEFIPASIWDSIPGISVYPRRAKVNTKKSKTAISASRSETVNYLFEKEGEVIFPATEYMYWNSNNKKFYRKHIDSVMIQVKPNPDLSMLSSIKKSLQKDTIEATETQEKPFLIFGLTPKTFVKYLIFVLVIGFVAIYLIKRLNTFIKHKRALYLHSETFAFNKLKKALNHHDYFAFSGASHTWVKKLNPEFETLEDLVEHSNSNALHQTLSELSHSVFKKEKTKVTLYSNVLEAIKTTRDEYFKNQSHTKKLATKNNKWLNPTSIN